MENNQINDMFLKENLMFQKKYYSEVKILELYTGNNQLDNMQSFQMPLLKHFSP